MLCTMTNARPPHSIPRKVRIWRWTFPVLAVIVALASHPSSQVDYLLTQAVYQAAMLLARQPNAVVLRGEGAEGVTGTRAGRLRLVEEIRTFAMDEMGLARLDSYTSVAVGFDRRMYNVLACRPDRFEPRGRWFPIVGSIPYLGFFRLLDTRLEARRMRDAGLDVSARPVGAYSTLGYFDDPILPPMLDWPEHRLADTLIHESAHATFFLAGQMRFNESFARFVGNEGARRFVEARRDVAPEAHRAAVEGWRDRERLQGLLSDLFVDLETLYDSGLPRDEILRRKADLLESARETCEGLPFHDPRYATYFERVEVNNATLMTYRTYNSGEDGFEALLADCDDDMRCFVDACHGADPGDPFGWLAERTGVEDPDTIDRP